jgi:uncharacterized repeat protein (TIGR03803 family)
VLYAFDTNGGFGFGPLAPVILDKVGNLYGTNFYGGSYRYGTVFKLDPSGKATLLHSFGHGTDGTNPQAGLVIEGKTLYGTTPGGGGAPSNGTVFKVVP